MKKTLRAAAATLALGGLVVAPALTDPASARASRAAVTITIKGSDPSGVVKSPRRVCKAGVTVRLVKQVGAKGGGDDVALGVMDTTSLQAGQWTYSFGNPGLSNGSYYARTRATSRCRAATSPTLVVTDRG